MKIPKRFFKSPKALQRPSRAASRRAGNDRTIGLQRPHDSASTTAQSSLNDRTMPEDGEKRLSGLAEHLPEGTS